METEGIIISMLCLFLIPIIVIIAGLILKSDKSSKINNVMGYRTKRSKSSDKAWRFAQNYSGKLMLNTGIIELIISIISIFALPMFLNLEVICFIVMSIDILLILFTIYKTEKELTKRFDEYGDEIEKMD